MHVTKQSDLYKLPLGAMFSVMNGGWNGRIVLKDNNKFLEVRTPQGYEIHPLMDSDAPLDLYLADIRVEESRLYTATANISAPKGHVPIYFYVQIPAWIPMSEEPAKAKAEAEEFLRTMLPEQKVDISVMACPSGHWDVDPVNKGA